MITTIVRPCIVFGPNVDNYLVRLWSKQPFTVDAGNLDGAIQFVHEDDVVEAISRLLLGRHAGQFNLSPDGLMTLRECAEILETPIRKMPFWLYPGIATVLWRLRLSEVPPGPARLRALPVDRLEREAEDDARLDAPTHLARELRYRDAGAGQAAGGSRRRPRSPRRTSPTRRWPRGRVRSRWIWIDASRPAAQLTDDGRSPGPRLGGHSAPPSATTRTSAITRPASMKRRPRSARRSTSRAAARHLRHARGGRRRPRALGIAGRQLDRGRRSRCSRNSRAERLGPSTSRRRWWPWRR